MKLAKWALKMFWLPILIWLLGRLGRKHEWAAKTHKVVKTFR